MRARLSSSTSFMRTMEEVRTPEPAPSYVDQRAGTTGAPIDSPSTRRRL